MRRLGASTVQEATDGLYCLYADHLAEVTALKLEIERLRNEASILVAAVVAVDQCAGGH
jgi:hypothetical protein